MLYQINKYHRTAAGETASSEKIEKPTSKEARETAMKTYFQYLSNYFADSSVLAFSVAVIDPSSMRILDSRVFVKEEDSEPVTE